MFESSMAESLSDTAEESHWEKHFVLYILLFSITVYSLHGNFSVDWPIWLHHSREATALGLTVTAVSASVLRNPSIRTGRKFLSNCPGGHVHAYDKTIYKIARRSVQCGFDKRLGLSGASFKSCSNRGVIKRTSSSENRRDSSKK